MKLTTLSLTTKTSLRNKTRASENMIYHVKEDGQSLVYRYKPDDESEDNGHEVLVSVNGKVFRLQKDLEDAVIPKEDDKDPVPDPPPSDRNTGILNAQWKGEMKKGENRIHFSSAPTGLNVGDPIALAYEGPRGTEAFKNWPEEIKQSITNPYEGQYARDVKSGETVRFSSDNGWQVYGKWAANKYYSYGMSATVKEINGQDVYIDQSSPIDWSGTIYYDNLPALMKLGHEANGWDFEGLGIKGDIFMSGPAYFQNKKFMKMFGNYVNLRSIPGFNSAGLWFENGNGITTPEVYGLNIYMHGGYDQFAPPVSFLNEETVNGRTWYNGPYLMSRGLALWTKGAIAREIKIYNAPSYALTIGEGAAVDGLEVHMDKSVFAEYTGWPIHMLGGGENGTVAPRVSNFKFVSERFMRAFEIQQATNGVFENGEVINGAFSQNNGINGTVRNVTFTIKENSCITDEKMKHHPIVQVNQLLAGSNESGMSFDNVQVTQEGAINPNGEVLKAWEFYPGTRGIKIHNCSSVRPDVPARDDFAGNSYGSHLGVPADGLEIDGFKAIGKAWPGHDWKTENNTANGPVVIYGDGSGSIKNMEAEKIIIDKAAAVKVENVKTDYPIL